MPSVSEHLQVRGQRLPQPVHPVGGGGPDKVLSRVVLLPLVPRAQVELRIIIVGRVMMLLGSTEVEHLWSERTSPSPSCDSSLARRPRPLRSSPCGRRRRSRRGRTGRRGAEASRARLCSSSTAQREREREREREKEREVAPSREQEQTPFKDLYHQDQQQQQERPVPLHAGHALPQEKKQQPLYQT